MPSLHYGIAVTVTRSGETVKTLLLEGHTDIPDPAKAGSPADTIPLHFDIPLDQVDGYAGRTAPLDVAVTAEQAQNAIAGKHQIMFEPVVELDELDLLDAAN